METKTRVRCGNHRGDAVYHDSVNAVRSCYSTPTVVRDDRPRQVAVEDMAQVRTLLSERVVDLPYRSALESYLAKGDTTTMGIRVAIARLSEMPTKPKTADVPAGRYAVEVDGVLKFYVVDKPTEGRWAGFTFVKVQASDELWPVKARGAREQILRLIAVDAHAAMIRYGQEIGKCGHCGRTLTDEESRARGIGPVCAVKLGI
jgi:hypothetical protein